MLRVKRLSSSARVPTKGTPFAAGWDLYSAYDYCIPARGQLLVSTDVAIDMPRGCYGRVAPRSGLALNHGICIGAGVIDADYRGPVQALMLNHFDEPYRVAVGDRVAQLILEKIFYCDCVEVDQLDETVRGSQGYGSTGV